MDKALFLPLIEFLDHQNGHYLYFSGEIERLELYRGHSNYCKNIEGLAPNDRQKPKLYQYYFVRYLSPAFDEKDGEGEWMICYRANGYCAERVAWINHLLAYDHYHEGQQAIRDGDDKKARTSFEKALERVTAARRYHFRGNERPGFKDWGCDKSTEQLYQDIHAANPPPAK